MYYTVYRIHLLRKNNLKTLLTGHHRRCVRKIEITRDCHRVHLAGKIRKNAPSGEIATITSTTMCRRKAALNRMALVGWSGDSLTAEMNLFGKFSKTTLNRPDKLKMMFNWQFFVDHIRLFEGKMLRLIQIFWRNEQRSESKRWSYRMR